MAPVERLDSDDRQDRVEQAGLHGADALGHCDHGRRLVRHVQQVHDERSRRRARAHDSFLAFLDHQLQLVVHVVAQPEAHAVCARRHRFRQRASAVPAAVGRVELVDLDRDTRLQRTSDDPALLRADWRGRRRVRPAGSPLRAGQPCAAPGASHRPRRADLEHRGRRAARTGGRRRVVRPPHVHGLLALAPRVQHGAGRIDHAPAALRAEDVALRQERHRLVVRARRVRRVGQRHAAERQRDARMRRRFLRLDVHRDRHGRDVVDRAQRPGRRALRIELGEEIAAGVGRLVLHPCLDLGAHVVVNRLDRDHEVVGLRVVRQRRPFAPQRREQVGRHRAHAVLLAGRLAERRDGIETRERPRVAGLLARESQPADVGVRVVGQVAARVDEVELLARPGEAHHVEQFVHVDQQVAVPSQVLHVGRQDRRVQDGAAAIAVRQQPVPGEEEEQAVVLLAAAVEPVDLRLDVAARRVPRGRMPRRRGEERDLVLGDHVQLEQRLAERHRVVDRARERTVRVFVDADDQCGALHCRASSCTSRNGLPRGTSRPSAAAQ